MKTLYNGTLYKNKNMQKIILYTNVIIKLFFYHKWCPLSFDIVNLINIQNRTNMYKRQDIYLNFNEYLENA
jgi:hypothetical protein